MSKLRVGTLCFATDQGLGILAKAFVDHGVITHPMVIKHGRRETHRDWYPDAPIISSLRGQYKEMLDFCRSMDIMSFLETPFAWSLIPACRDAGVKTVIMPMHECCPDPIPEQPDLWLCPSLLDLAWAAELSTDVVNLMAEGLKRAGHTPEISLFRRPDGTAVHFLPVPVEVPWRQRTRVEVFVHNAGYGGLKGRNGTAEVLEAIPYLKSSAKLIIRSQTLLAEVRTGRYEVRCGNVPYDQLWQEGDCLLFPERFNGLSLPLQEARAAGILVMGSDRFPMNTWLPRAPLIPVKEYRKNRVLPGYHEFDEAVINPKDIAAAVDAWYGQNIADYSLSGREWAEQHSWERLGPKYQELLEGLR